MRFIKESFINAPPERVFAFHESPDALARLMPPWEKARIIQMAPDLKPGARTVIETTIFGLISTRWVAEHTLYDPPWMFEDTQISGPFKSWRHKHIISPSGQGALLRDEIEFEPPAGLLGRIAAPFLILPRLEKMFDFRHRVTREWCESEDKLIDLDEF